MAMEAMTTIAPVVDGVLLIACGKSTPPFEPIDRTDREWCAGCAVVVRSVDSADSCSLCQR
jgi:hypothetical protein